MRAVALWLARLLAAELGGVAVGFVMLAAWYWLFEVVSCGAASR